MRRSLACSQPARGVDPSLGGRRSASRSSSGLTLLELMIVVTVIGVVAMTAGPSIADAMGERRANELTNSLVRLARQGRSEAVGYGRAHLLRYLPEGNGAFELYRGTSNLCRLVPWDGEVLTEPCAIGVAGQYCRGWVDAATISDSSVDYRFLRQTGAGELFLCFEPSGRVMWGTTTNNFTDASDAPFQRGAVVFEVRRRVAGADRGVNRQVAIPLGGDVRVLR